jgi:hypothetical protein
MTRAEAKALGLKRYDPGKPCKHGHAVGLWLTARGCCPVCQRATNAKPENVARRANWQKTPAGSVKVAEAKARYRETPAGREHERAYSKATLPRMLARFTARYAEDAELRERYLERKRAWRQANTSKMRDWDIARKSRRARATLILPEHQDLVDALYSEGREIGLEVDHIVPITHPLVCGLHIPCKLRLLGRAANRAKSNAFEPYQEVFA